LSKANDISDVLIKEFKQKIELYGSRTDPGDCSERKKLNPNFCFLLYSYRSHSSNKDPNPEPVPPPTELNIKNPSKSEHFSVIFLI